MCIIYIYIQYTQDISTNNRQKQGDSVFEQSEIII